MTKIFSKRIQLWAVGFLLLLTLVSLSTPRLEAQALFSENLRLRVWKQFEADGFKNPVCGMIFTDARPPCCGVPVGGLGTGCLDIEAAGVWGFSSVFRPALMVEPTPYQTLRNPKLYSPILGLSVGKKTWVLANNTYTKAGKVIGCVDPVDPGNYTENKTYMKHWTVELNGFDNVQSTRAIRYWGHFPVADLQYNTNAPVSVSMRAWAPFLPGDSSASGIPGAVFEVRLRNVSKSPQEGRLAFNFPGPHKNEVGTLSFSRKETIDSSFVAMNVTANRSSYTLAVLDEKETEVDFGGNLSSRKDAWAKIGSELPEAVTEDAATSATVKYRLAPSESKTVRFVLGWMVTDWKGGAYEEIKHFDETWAKNEFTLSKTGRFDRETYYPMYTTRYQNTLEVVQELARDHESLLRRVLSWQEALFARKELPIWLRDALLNNLALFAEDSLWAAPRGKIASWAAPLGAFHMTENPRACSIVGCTASNYYGDLPIVYFFPELERMILRSYLANMRPDGAVPFLYPPRDFIRASYEWQIGLNGACYADLVHRMWLRTRDRTLLEEFYPSVKKSTIFTVNLAKGPHGLISFHREGHGQEWWEHTPVFGMVTHLAGVRMAQIEMAKNMAKEMGDTEFVKQCDEWIQRASQLTEENLWNEKNGSYDFFKYPEKNKYSQDIMSSQLDGQWMVDLHGLPAVFKKDRIATVLKTVAATCLVDTGMAGFSEPGKGPDLARYGTFPPEVNIVAMTYMYNENRELGLEIARRNMTNLIKKHGYGWDLPNLIRCDTGRRTYGCDYYQNMVLWGLPAAMAGQDLSGPCGEGGVVNEMLSAAAGEQ